MYDQFSGIFFSKASSRYRAVVNKKYAKALKIAYEKGVEIIPLQVKVSPEKIEISKELPFELLFK